MRIFEALVLFFLGLFFGLTAGLGDVLAIGHAAFIAHGTLWILLNVALGSLVDERGKAVWWSVPLSLGFIESYFIATVASFESFVKSSVAPLALTALLAPLLTYAAWTAKEERNIYGYLLRICLMLGTLACDFIMNESVTVFGIVVTVLVALMLWLPFKRFRFSRLVPKRAERAAASQETSGPKRTRSNRKRPRRTTSERESGRPARQSKKRSQQRPQRRTGQPRTRRSRATSGG